MSLPTGKDWWLSRTVWVNIVAFAAFMAQASLGYDLSPELQGVILTVLNLFLRFDTHEGIR